MTRQYSYFKTQTPTSNGDYTQTITEGFEFVPQDSIVTKLSICAETNLHLIMMNGDKVMNLYLKAGTVWAIDNDDAYNFMSIKCGNPTAKVSYMIGYRDR